MKNPIITSEIKKTYQIEDNENRVSIHAPAFVNVEKDSEFEIQNNGVTLTIQNSKVSVALWIETKLMHVTVYP